MGNCAIVGINWGDEGKGRMVDFLTGKYDIVVRYQGGGNAGHTVVNDYGKFALHLLPSGIFHENVVNVIGNGVALDPENLISEIATVAAKGVKIGGNNLKISDRASLLLPGTGNRTPSRRPGWRTENTAPQSRASRLFTRTNTRKRRSSPANFSTRTNFANTWRS